MVKMNINISVMVVTAINLLILFLMVKHFLFDKVSAVIKNRQQSIEETISKADEDLEKARALKIENQRVLKSAKEEGKKIVQEFKGKADDVYKEIVEDAKRESISLMERSKVEVERERTKAEAEIRNQAVELALLLSAKALEGSIDETKHRQLIDDYISKVGI